MKNKLREFLKKMDLDKNNSVSNYKIYIFSLTLFSLKIIISNRFSGVKEIVL